MCSPVLEARNPVPVASFIASGLGHRAFVEVEQAPRLLGPLEDREGAVVLTDREQPPRRKPECAADECAVRAPVRDDRDRLARMGVGDRLERRPRAGLEVRDAFPVGERELADVRHPLGELLRFAALNLRGGQAFPAAHRHLAELGHHRRREPVRPADDCAGSPGADQIAGEYGAELHRRQAGGLSDALALAQRRKRHVEMADESPRLGEDDLAVAEQIDQRPRCDHADTVRRPASSAISIAAPSTSPVIPATRAAKKRVTTSALATETTTTTIPSTRSATMATTRAMDSAIGAARAPTPAPNAAPCPSDFAGANRRASKDGVARATPGTTSSAWARMPGGSSVTAAISRSSSRMRPSAPNAPIRLSRMMASRCAASRPPSPSRQSASPSRWRPPVRSFHAVTVSKPARSKGNKSSVTRSVTTRITPIPTPITGNQGAARPRALGLVRAGPGRGTIVR